ncbi:MAG: hypothetical protein AMJ38_05270 [Dehalococcoidia bacterium DG_22]|nr:MAG: hypothetical protein AMJ38_05270 [Dehalococcoidia bacterium DG_22]
MTREATGDEETVAVGLRVAVGLAVGEGSVDRSVAWQAARATQARMRAQRNEKRDRGRMNLEGVRGLGEEWLAMGSPP